MQQNAPAQTTAVAPPEVPTAGRPQGTEKFGPSVDGIPIIDAHIHLFDGTRPQGAGYMGSAAYRAKSRTSLPGLYAPLARPSGIVGAIIVESSAWVEDNLWYLLVSQADPIMVGVSGRLDPYKPEFGEYLERYHKNPLYRAIRASRFYTNTDGKVTLDPVAVENLKLLAQAGLAQDTANPSIPLMTANVMLADAIPSAAHHHGSSAVIRSHTRRTGRLRGGGQGNGCAAQHLRQTERGVSSADREQAGRRRRTCLCTIGWNISTACSVRIG